VNGLHTTCAPATLPLVFLHSWPQSSYQWRHLIARCPGATVIAPDLRGLVTPRSRATLRQAHARVRRTRAAATLSIPRISLVGHDWGGAVCSTSRTTTGLVELLIFDMIPDAAPAARRPSPRRSGTSSTAEPDPPKFVRRDVEGYLRHFFTSTD
jgi:pimeloyl-ACP methyl ester carboxylesterase